MSVGPLRDDEKFNRFLKEAVPVNVGAVQESGRASQAARESEQAFRAMINALPAAIYTTDAKGKITHFNPACIEFAGRTPTLGSDYWCVTWKLFHPDGRPLPHDECPMAIALKEARVVRGAEAIAERPDGTRVWFTEYPTPLFDDAGELVGGINMIVDITERKTAESLIECQKRSLELVVAGAPLEGDGGILDFLARSMERYLDGAIVAIHLMEPDGYHFGYVAGPSLPAKYVHATRGIDARLELGCCSSAVVSQTATIVRDFADDLPRTRWPAFTAEMIALGLRGCFTTPIISAEKRVLGTFAIYYREPRHPSPRHLQLVDFVTGTVALAIGREQADKALRKSEERHRQLLSLMPAAVYSCDANGVITYYNERAAQLWGRAPQIGDTSERFCGSDQMISPDGMPLPHEQCPMAVALRDGHSFRDTEVNIRQPNGTIVPVLANIDPIRDEQGKVIGAINAFYDISAIKQAEKARHESEQRFRMLADNMDHLAWTCDELGNATWYNQRWLEYTGMSVEEMKDWGWTKCHHPDYVDGVIAGIARSRETGEIWEDTFPLRAKDGSYRWFLARALPIRDANGEIVCWFGTNTDIEDLEQAREAAESANRVKDEFLATVSHELRTPLNAIMGWTHLLTRGEIDEETSARGLETIARNASAQNQLISDLLDVSRIISGQLRFESGVVDLVSVIDAASESVRPVADSRGIVLQHELDRGAGLVSGDGMRLQQIVWNLLSNAIKFTSSEGQITVRLKRENTSVVLSVSDTGEGISAEFLPYIFDRFRQAERTSRRQQIGLGLGLAIVRHLVEAHGGTISAASKGIGKGATFTVMFPLLAVHEDAINAKRAFFLAGSASSTSAAILKEVRVLVIDDEEDARELLSIALTHSGAEVRTAGTVQAALDILNQWKPDVIVSDIAMPGEDGYDLIRKVRALESETGETIPALALTGYASAEDASRARVSGYQTHIAKPATPSDLVLAVASLATKASAHGGTLVQ